MTTTFDRDGLLRVATARFQLPHDSFHGPARHWLAVEQNGLRLADALGADRDVVSVFALLHDCCRENEDYDPMHGHRAAEFAATLQGVHFEFDERRLGLLLTAIREHNGAPTSEQPELDACYSADRFELPRVGITPRRKFFSARSWAVWEQVLKERQLAMGA